MNCSLAAPRGTFLERSATNENETLARYTHILAEGDNFLREGGSLAGSAD